MGRSSYEEKEIKKTKVEIKSIGSAVTITLDTDGDKHEFEINHSEVIDLMDWWLWRIEEARKNRKQKGVNIYGMREYAP